MSKLIHITSLPKGVSTGLITSKSGSLLFCSTTHIFSLCTKVNIKSKMCNAVARGVNDIVMTKITTFLITTPCHGWKKNEDITFHLPFTLLSERFSIFIFVCRSIFLLFMPCHILIHFNFPSNTPSVSVFFESYYLPGKMGGWKLHFSVHLHLNMLFTSGFFSKVFFISFRATNFSLRLIVFARDVSLSIN